MCARPHSVNASLRFVQEAEFEHFHAPEEFLKEEKALHKEREARGAAEQAALKEASEPEGLALGKQRFNALEQLLHQSHCYTQFLAEQMATIEQQTERDAKRFAGTEAGTSTTTEDPKSKNNCKRMKAGVGKAAKKAKHALTPTQVGTQA